MTTRLKVSSVYPNPDQPRKEFDISGLQELAASITENGLLQPITVRRAPATRKANGQFNPRDDAGYMIVAGERRWRAHQIAGMEFVDCNVVSMDDDDLAIAAIVENLQRLDISPLEEARAFQRMVDAGYTAETLAARLGMKQSFRISDRLQLMRLRPEYLDLLGKKQLTPSQAFELSRLDTAMQPALFSMIVKGQAKTFAALRAASDGFLCLADQAQMFDLPPAPTLAELETLSKFERLIEKLVGACNDGIKENEVVVLKKVDPSRAALIVQQLGLIRADLARMEKALQQSVAQGELLAA